MATVPPTGWVTLMMDRVSPLSGLMLSLARTASVLGPLSSRTVNVSLTAVGLSLTGVTVTETVAVDVKPPGSRIV
jgi:hypothetical protein